MRTGSEYVVVVMVVVSSGPSATANAKSPGKSRNMMRTVLCFSEMQRLNRAVKRNNGEYRNDKLTCKECDTESVGIQQIFQPLTPFTSALV